MGAFRCAYLSTHKPRHSQSIVCEAEALSTSHQSVSIRDVPTDRHTAVVFVFHSRHSLPAHFFSSTELQRRSKRTLIVQSINVLLLKVKLPSYVQSFLVFLKEMLTWQPLQVSSALLNMPVLFVISAS